MLLNSGACVLAVEKDRELCAVLRQKGDWVRGSCRLCSSAAELTLDTAQAESGRLLVVEQDAIESNFPQLLAQLQEMAERHRSPSRAVQLNQDSRLLN